MLHLPAFLPWPLPETARNLLRALAVSLALHALLLTPERSALTLPGDTVAGASQLRARLHASAGAPPPVETPAREAAPLEPLPSEPAPSRQPQERSYDTAPAAVAETSAAPAAEAPAGGQNGVDVAGLREYHLALGRSARQFRRYPPTAREAGWAGRVVIRIEVAEGGNPNRLRLISGSGHEVLDQAALEMLYLAAGHTPVPDSLRGRSFNIDLAIDFNPADAPAEAGQP